MPLRNNGDGTWTLSLNMNDSVAQKLKDYYTTVYAYQDFVNPTGEPGGEIPNPESKNKFTARKIKDELIEKMRQDDAVKAAVAAKDAVLAAPPPVIDEN